METAAHERTSWGERVIRWAQAGWLLILLAAWIGLGAGAQERATIRGTVRDSKGAPVSDAVVRLQSGSAVVAETRSHDDGVFLFSGVAAGEYSATAEKAGMGNAFATVRVVGAGGPSLTLTLRETAPGAGMEFADAPNFTIAGVTDWTAVGGHGSDTVLRASEALNREAIRLGPGEGTGAPEPETDAWKERESGLRAAVEKNPADFAGNHALGEFYLEARRDGEAVAPLAAAYRIRPENFANELELARALQGAGRYADAREHVRKVLAHGKSDEAERMAGELDEKLGDPLTAVREFERAARENPSERNYFEWGSELLLHRAVWQAKEVFTTGVKAHPESERMMTALGATLFAGALYDQAALRLCAASDLDPQDPEPYEFMGRIVTVVSDPLPCVTPRLKRFVEKQPADGLGTYYYAMALWKHDGQPVDAAKAAPVEALLQKAVATDPKCAAAWLQLGVLRFLRKDYAGSVEFFQRAAASDPAMSDAHYRLAMAYDRVGERDKAKTELALHQKLDQEQKAEVERQRRAIKQFRVLGGPEGSGAGGA